MKTVTSILCAVIATTLTASAWSKDYFYCGVINARKPLPIILEVRDEAKTQRVLSARYFYRQHGQIIPLKLVSANEENVALAENLPNSKANFSLARDESALATEDEVLKSDVISGHWQDGKNKYPVMLYALEEDPIIPDNERSLETYRKGLTQKKVRLGSTEVMLVPNKTHNFSFYYKITQYKDPSQIPALNQWLRTNFLSASADDDLDDAESSCDDIRMRKNDEFTLISEDILFINDRDSGNMFRAAYPLNNEGKNTYFDLAIKKELSINNIFSQFGKKQIDLFFAAKRKKALEMAKTAKKDERGNYILDENNDNDNDDGCWDSYLPQKLNNMQAYNFDIDIDKQKRRIGLSKIFPHASNVCNQDYQYVETAKIAPYLNKQTSLYRFLTSK